MKGMSVLVCNLSALKMETRGLGIQGHSRLSVHMECEASLCCLGSFLKQSGGDGI